MTRLRQNDVARGVWMTRRPLLFRWSLLVVLVCLAVLLQARVASAGVYDVYACDASHSGGISPSWWVGADVDHAAYYACPAFGEGDGIIARSAWDGRASGYLQGAYAIFDAPRGTVVESFSAWIYMQRPDCSWSVGVYAGGYDLGGHGVHNLPPGWCSTNVFSWVHRDLAINQPRVRIEARCGASSCPRTRTYDDGPPTAEVRIKDVRVRVRDEQPPQIANPRGSLWTDGWVSGPRDVAFDASDGSGIRETVVRVDGHEVKRNLKRCDYLVRAPCPQEGFATTIETAAIAPDGRHRLSLEAIDTGGNPTVIERDVYVDNTAPGPPQDLTLVGGDGWRADNAFDVRWTNPREEEVAPLAGAEYELCPVGSDRCIRGSRSGSGLAAIEDLSVPAPGEYVLKVWLRDEAGNHDARTAAPAVHLRFDGLAPDLEFEPLDPADPTQLAVRAADSGSGIARARIEIKPRRSQVWRPLETQVAARRILARVDDERLRDGIYDLRAWAADHAANERTTERRRDGDQATIRMPIRVKTHLRVAMIRAAARQPRGRARVPFGRPAWFRGRLLSRDGNPIQEAEVLVFARARRRGAPERVVATLRTTRRGGFAYRAPEGVSRTIRFRYGGTHTVRSATRKVTLFVRARSSIRPSRRAFVNGEVMRLRGRLRGSDIPAEGKLVELQVLLRGRWRTFATTRADVRGIWSYDYRFDGTRGIQMYRFRARVPREATYPYETGLSRPIAVRVRGL